MKAIAEGNNNVVKNRKFCIYNGRKIVGKEENAGF